MVLNVNNKQSHKPELLFRHFINKTKLVQILLKLA